MILRGTNAWVKATTQEGILDAILLPTASKRDKIRQEDGLEAKAYFFLFFKKKGENKKKNTNFFSHTKFDFFSLKKLSN